MPRQFEAPSHVLLREVAARLFPARFDYSGYVPPVASPESLAKILRPLGALNIWETRYFQHLSAGEGHPVRRFTQSTAAGPILAKLDELEQLRFLAAYDDALAQAYPLAGAVILCSCGSLLFWCGVDRRVYFGTQLNVFRRLWLFSCRKPAGFEGGAR